MNEEIIEKIKKNWDKEKIIKFVQYSAETSTEEDEKIFFLAIKYYLTCDNK